MFFIATLFVRLYIDVLEPNCLIICWKFLKNKPTEFWKIYDNLKQTTNLDHSNNIAPQKWYNYFYILMNVNYKNNFVVDGECKFVHCNNEILNADITAEKLLKAVKSLKNKKYCCSDCITNEMINVYCTLYYNLYVDIFNLILRSGLKGKFH